MSAVHKYSNSTPAAPRCDLRDPHNPRAGAGDAVNDDDARLRRDRRINSLNDAFLRTNRFRKVDRLYPRTMNAYRILGSVSDRAVGVIGNDQFVVFTKVETAQHRIHAACRIVDEYEV